MRRLARGYSIHLRNRAALIHRNGDFGIKIRRKPIFSAFWSAMSTFYTNVPDGPATLDVMPDYLLHEIREVLQALMANPACTAGARKLAELLRRVNKEQTHRG